MKQKRVKAGKKSFYSTVNSFGIVTQYYSYYNENGLLLNGYLHVIGDYSYMPAI